MRVSDKTQGIAFVLFAATCFGLEPVIAKTFYTHSGSPLFYTFMRCMFSALGTLCLLFFLKSPLKKAWVFSHLFSSTSIILGVLFGLFFVCLHQAVSVMAVPLAVTVVFLYPLISGLLSYLFKESGSSSGILATLGLAFFGIYLTLAPQISFLNPLGLTLALSAALLYGVQIFWGSRLMKNEDPMGVSLGVFVVASLTLVILLPVTGQFSAITSDVVAPTLLYALLGGILSTFSQAALFQGMKRLPNSTTSLLLNWEIPISVMGAYLILGEILTPLQYLGCGIVLASISLAPLLRNLKGANQRK